MKLLINDYSTKQSFVILIEAFEIELDTIVSPEGQGNIRHVL